MVELPSGTVTFLFTDIEGSTRLWEEHPEAMRDALARHDELVRDAIEGHGGYVVKTTGDGFHAAFGTAGAGVAAAVAAQRALDREAWSLPEPLRVRMGLHTGAASLREGDYYGGTLNRAARLMGVAHGGQVVCSQATTELARDVLAEGVEFVDLGEHRLRDLTRAERVFQVNAEGLTSDFAALTSVDAFPGNLPLQVSSFIGREREIARTVDALASSRVVTLTGVGGVGKTRLALQVAAEVLPRFREGAWLVELAPVRDPAGVADAFASVFAVTARAGQTMTEAFVEFLGTKQLLLVVDNCEHLLDAVAGVVTAVERSCPGVAVLATSREGLALDGERVVPVPSLGAPDPGDDLAAMEASESVQLFVDRAAAVDPEFVFDDGTVSGVVQVCRRLDGMPLAIELAAAQVSMMSPGELAEALDRRFDVLAGGRRGGIERHQTLRATIDWSYDMLGEAHQRLLARLSVFAGGCTREAAEAVCSGSPVEARAVLGLLRELVARSLVVADRGGPDTRYRLLETIRAYGEERLAEHDETEEVRDRHARYYIEYISRLFDVTAPGSAWTETGRRIEVERDNALVATNHALDTGDVDMAVKLLVLSLGMTWFTTGYWVALAPEPVRALPGVDAHPGYPFVLAIAAAVAGQRGDVARCDELSEAAGAAAAQVEVDAFDNPVPFSAEMIVTSARVTGQTASGDWHGAAALQLHQLELTRAAGATRFDAIFLNGAAWMLNMAGDHDAAVPVATEALASARASGVPSVIASSLAQLAHALATDDPARARALLDEAVPEFSTGREYEGVESMLLIGSAFAAARLGDWPLTARCAVPLIRFQHWYNMNAGLVGTLNLAARVLADTDAAATATLLGAVRVFLPPARVAPGPDAPRADADPGATFVSALHREATRRAREALGDDPFRTLRTEGAAMDRDSAVAYTLAHLDAYLANRILTEEAEVAE